MGIYAKRGRLYLRFKDRSGAWVAKAALLPVGEERRALEMLSQIEAAIAAPRPPLSARAPELRGAEGWFYIFALVPELSRARVKMGFTSDINQRARAYRTSNPTCCLLGAWPSDRAWEKDTIATLARWCRLVGGEVFEAADVDELLREAEHHFQRPREIA